MSGTVVALFLNHASRAPLTPVVSARALAGIGLEGDRHARAGSLRQVLLIEQETLDEFGLVPGDVREQVTTRGMDLHGLAEGALLRAGEAVLMVGRTCAPCERMNELKPGLMQALTGRRGRFVRVLEAGTVTVGDALVLE